MKFKYKSVYWQTDLQFKMKDDNIKYIFMIAFSAF